jgi:polyisoprenoid-binding protein YceI
MTATSPAPLSPADSALPLAPGRWTLDPSHSGVQFAIRHLGLSNVRGRFDRFDATLDIAPALEGTAVTAEIDMSSVDTNQPDRDAHLRSTDFFHADEHPTMTFRSTAVTSDGDGRSYELAGDLTINGVTRPVTLQVEFLGTEVFPVDQRVHAGFFAAGEIRRSDFGVDFNMPLGIDKLGLGEKVKIELDLQFVAP